MPSDNNLLTPIAQDALIVALNSVIPRLIMQDYRGAWYSLKALYHLLPPKVAEEIKPEYDKIPMSLKSVSSTDPYFGCNFVTEQQNNFLEEETYLLLEKIKNVMAAKGYYLFESNRPPTRESSMKDLELTVAKAKYGK